MGHSEELKRRQELGKEAYDRMLATLLGFTPCEILKVGDVQYIARMCQTITFDVLSVKASEGNDG